MSSIGNLEVVCKCWKTSAAWCERYLAFPMNVSNMDIIIVFVDKFGIQYKQLISVDANGIAIVDTSLFPEQLFNPHAGIFKVYAYVATLTDADRVFFNTGLDVRPCLLIDFHIEVRNFSYTPPYNVNLTAYLCCCSQVPPCPNKDFVCPIYP